jgi:hypothetical protein
MYGIPSLLLAFFNLSRSKPPLPFSPIRPEVEVLKSMALDHICTASFKYLDM